MLQANTITQNTNFGAVATFNFNAGTLQASPQGTVNHPAGLVNAMQITVGTAASNVATVDANGQTVTLNGYAYPYPGALSGPGQLRVIDSVGGGTVTLGGSDINGNPMPNYYTGGTTVLSGTLEVLYAQALPNTGVLTIGGPGSSVRAAFNLNGTQQTTQGLITASSLVSPDLNFQIPGTDLLTVTGGLVSINPGTDITLGTLPAATPGIYYDLIAGDASASSDLANFSLVGANGFHLAVDPANGDIAVAAVPEPGTLALLGDGLLSLLGVAWRRRKAG